MDSDAAVRNERAPSERQSEEGERERQVIDSDAARGGERGHGRQGCSVVDLHTCAREEDRMRRGEGGKRVGREGEQRKGESERDGGREREGE